MANGDNTEKFIDLVAYYAAQLIYQYIDKPKAKATIEAMAEMTMQPQTYDVAHPDPILPLAVLNGFNLIGDNLAIGVQLDIIGKYAGVKRSYYGLSSNITLNDFDFSQLIKMAINKNSSQSSLAAIQEFIHNFFPGQMLVYDYANMSMAYVLSQNMGSSDLIQLFITQGLLPKPMGVRITAIVNPPNINLFSFRTYDRPAQPNSSPFNTYDDYQLDWPWLSYTMAV